MKSRMTTKTWGFKMKLVVVNVMRPTLIDDRRTQARGCFQISDDQVANAAFCGMKVVTVEDGLGKTILGAQLEHVSRFNLDRLLEDLITRPEPTSTPSLGQIIHKD